MEIVDHDFKMETGEGRRKRLEFEATPGEAGATDADEKGTEEHEESDKQGVLPIARFQFVMSGCSAACNPA